MGESYTLACMECEYRDHVSDGSGMSVQILEPMVCRSCRRVVTVMVSPPDPEHAAFPIPADEKFEVGVCPHCGGSEFDAWGSFGVEDEGGQTLDELMSPSDPEAGPCPRCGGDIQLGLEALWDRWHRGRR